MQYIARLTNRATNASLSGTFDGPDEPELAAAEALKRFGGMHKVVTIYPAEQADRVGFDVGRAKAVLRQAPRMTVQRLRNLTGFFLQAEERAVAEGRMPLAAFCQSMAGRFRRRLAAAREQ